MQKFLYEIGDATQNTPEISRDFEIQLQEVGVICPICRKLLIRKPIDVYINSRVLKSYAPVTYPSPVPIGMIRKDILNDIGLELFSSVFYIGQVFDNKKHLSGEYVSFVSRFPEKELTICGDNTSIDKV